MSFINKIPINLDTKKKNEKRAEEFLHVTINSQESVLGTWITVMATLTTTGLLFYHMSNSDSSMMYRPIAGIFCCVLVLSALFYNIFSLYNFIIRSDILYYYQTNQYFKKKIKESQIFYGIFTFLVSIIQLLIVIFILKRELKIIFKQI